MISFFFFLRNSNRKKKKKNLFDQKINLFGRQFDILGSFRLSRFRSFFNCIIISGDFFFFCRCWCRIGGIQGLFTWIIFFISVGCFGCAYIRTRVGSLAAIMNIDLKKEREGFYISENILLLLFYDSCSLLYNLKMDSYVFGIQVEIKTKIDSTATFRLFIKQTSDDSSVFVSIVFGSIGIF